MNNESKSDAAQLPSSIPPIPDNVYVSWDEWELLNDQQRQFLIEAAEVSMSHIVENGEVLAWGFALAEFTMPVDAKRHPDDGWVVTLAEQS